MLRDTPYQDVRDIGLFLVDAGYGPERLSEELELSDGPYANGENLPALLLKTEGESLLAVLARLFFVGWPVPEAICSRVVPAAILERSLACGLLARSDGNLEAQASLVPFRNQLVACDCIRLHGGSANMVVGPSGTSTQFLARLAVDGAEETTLDVGCGSGVLAIGAAAYSRSVTGIDINPRALPFAAFSAALNGITNASFLCGDAFGPVAGRRFSRVLANPPFFLSPAKKFIYCDSPLELDGFARRLAMEAPEYLEDGGYFQMICQWVELENEGWEQRLREWTAHSACDVLVLLAPRSKPITYAEIRLKEARVSETAAPEFDFASRVNYLRDRGVTGILSGVITMRKRTGKNWFSILATDPAGPCVGPGVRERFETLTILATSTESELFKSRFRFAPDVQLETITAPGGPRWSTQSIQLVKSETLVDRLRIDPAVASCLPLFDGQRTVADVAELVSAELSIAQEQANQQCVQLVRRLLQTSYLLPAR